MKQSVNDQSQATAYILGAGAHGRVVLDVLIAEARWASFCFIDENAELRGTSINGAKVVGNLQYLLEQDRAGCGVIVALGHNHLRERLCQQIEKAGLTLINTIHPLATVVRSAQIGRGNMICAGAVVNSNARIETGVIVNTCAVVEHDSIIKSFASLSPGAMIGGRAEIGQGAFLGINATILPKVKVGDGAIIGAGSLAAKDVPERVFACGSPLRMLEKVTDDFDYGRIF